ncbi:MAG: hypothetical protein IJO61_03775 [Oscillospiraceae bacterium]|nr:hypothetical protein [Oscillospiraceae bacterium]MBQ7119157.1 hypothetical protein [Oscillospiraceae bacterium]
MKKLLALILALCMMLAFAACDDSEEMFESEVSGKAPGSEEKETEQKAEVNPGEEALPGDTSETEDETAKKTISESDLIYRDDFTLAEAFEHMNSVRYVIYEKMYSAVLNLDDESAWVPAAIVKYNIGSEEFLAASHVMEKGADTSAEAILSKQGFTNISITTLDVENSWKITARKENANYEYTIRYGVESESYRFTLAIDGVPQMLLACIRTAGGYAVEIWTDEGSYHILADDAQEGRFGFIPSERTNQLDFPETDIFYEESYIAKEFATKDAEHTFLLANKILYIAKDGSNYAIPLK